MSRAAQNSAHFLKPGPGVLYVRIAASNVHLKKKSRGLLVYTPAGFVVTAAVASSQAMEQKASGRIAQPNCLRDYGAGYSGPRHVLLHITKVLNQELCPVAQDLVC
jgi:hypothetical protein